MNSMSKYRCLCAIFFLAAVPAFVGAQTANDIESLLGTKSISYGQAARFVLDAAEIDGYNRSNPEDAFRFAVEQRWLPEKANPSDPINLQRFSLLFMRAFGIKGGPMYSIFKTSHYAYRDMVYQDIIQGRADPGMAVSGESLLFLVNRILYRIDDDPWVLPEETRQTGLPLEDEINAQLAAMGITDVGVELTDGGIIISIYSNQFLTNSLDIQRKERESLRRVGLILKAILARDDLRVDHAMPTAWDNHFRESVERARAIADYLIKLGGGEADEPVTNNNTPEETTPGRRVKILILEDL
jgi:flagellar motor protein MotB